MNLLLPLSEPRPDAVTAAVDVLASTGGLEERGAVFTRADVVAAILDLCGYTPDLDLAERRLLEPSFGNGDFLLPAIRRLAEAFARSGAPMDRAAALLGEAIRGVELHRESFERTSERAVEVLVEAGFEPAVAQQLVGRWLINDDFLLADIDGEFDFVVGNPPYVRQERIPEPLLKAYKRRYATLYDRADLYVPFFDRGLDLLREGGVLGFICANRWLKNKYGGPLRQKVGEGFHLEFFIDLERADAFHSEVIAYPAITVIRRAPTSRTLVALSNRDTAAGLDQVVVDLMAAAERPGAAVEVPGIAELVDIACGRDPWLLDAPEILNLLRSLEHRLPTLEDAGAKVGIGVATGADRVFVGKYDDLPVEDARKLRLAMAADCKDGGVDWGGLGVVNPYLASGQLAPLKQFPRFAHYLETHGDALKRRHTARQQPGKWYKTIDRIYPDLTATPKLLIPDIKGVATISYDDGHYYPHHNLYVVTSEFWDLRALQAILRSSVSLMFVAAYCVRMSGGFLRFQAQYLRRIRCPHWYDLDAATRAALVGAATEPEQDKLDAVVMPLFGLHARDATTVRTYARDNRVERKGP